MIIEIERAKIMAMFFDSKKLEDDMTKCIQESHEDTERIVREKHNDNEDKYWGDLDVKYKTKIRLLKLVICRILKMRLMRQSKLF